MGERICSLLSPITHHLSLLSDAVEAQAKLVVEEIDVGAAIGEEARLPEDHGPAAVGQIEAVSVAVEESLELRVELLRHAVANRFLRGRREAERAARV